jgi:hypothetical protein
MLFLEVKGGQETPGQPDYVGTKKYRNEEYRRGALANFNDLKAS